MVKALLKYLDAEKGKAQADVARYKMLVDKDEIPRQVFDQAVATANALAATVESSKATAAAAQKVIEQRSAQLEQTRSRP